MKLSGDAGARKIIQQNMNDVGNYIHSLTEELI
jgi:hypothetical protein